MILILETRSFQFTATSITCMEQEEKLRRGDGAPMAFIELV